MARQWRGIGKLRGVRSVSIRNGKGRGSGVKVTASAKGVECPECETGIQYCEETPCWGTIPDMQRIIDAGYGAKLMVDYWSMFDPDYRVEILCGASTGYEGHNAPYERHQCTFLAERKCTIHAIKPLEGRVACCKLEPSRLREGLAKHWDSEKGRALVAKWRETYGKPAEQAPSEKPINDDNLISSLLGGGS